MTSQLSVFAKEKEDIKLKLRRVCRVLPSFAESQNILSSLFLLIEAERKESFDSPQALQAALPMRFATSEAGK